MHIKQLNFNLPSDILKELKNLNWHNLELSTSFDYKNYLHSAWTAGFLFNFLLHYKGNPLNAGCVKNFVLPAELSAGIKLELDKILSKEIVDQAIIRLQLIYGGTGLPLHVDPTRSASIVYPVSHPYYSETRIFSQNKNLNSRGLKDYQKCCLKDMIEINDQPVLIDTDQPHDVWYAKNIYTEKQPRVSLTVKFETVKFDQLTKILC
jgi:hypothetical protein